MAAPAAAPTLASILAKTQGRQPAINASRAAPPTKVDVPAEQRIPELSSDAFNNDEYGIAPTRRVVTSAPPAAFVADTAPVNVCHVERAPPKAAAPMDAHVPVVRAAQKAGRHAAAVAAVFPAFAVDAVESPVQGLLSRVVQAKLCADTGATASRVPNVAGWDVRAGRVNKFPSLLRQFPAYTPLAVPRSMTHEAACALASLCLPGGAGAYNWRYRVQPPAAGPGAGAGAMPDEPGPRNRLMPAYARWLHPGGSVGTLLLCSQTQSAYVFGGAALTTHALDSLVYWCRSVFGNMLVDQAFRTAVACGHVYVPPGGTWDPGHNLRGVEVTTTDNNVNLGAVAWTDQQAWDPAVLQVAWRQPQRDLLHLDADEEQALMDTMALLHGVSDDRITLLVISLEKGTITVVCDADDARAVRLTSPLHNFWLWTSNPANGADRTAAAWANTWATNRMSLASQYEPGAIEPFTGNWRAYRNVFGASDASTMVFPAFNLLRVGPAIAGLHLTLQPRTAAPTNLGADRDNDVVRYRQYAAKLHVGSMFVYVSKNFWPEDLNDHPVRHGQFVSQLPAGLQPLTYISDLGRDHLEASNWQLLDTAHRLAWGGAQTAYYGFSVPGSWTVARNGRVEVCHHGTDFAALDAALRLTWLYGGQINANEPGCVVVKDAYGMPCALGVAPQTYTRQRPASLTLAIGRGPNLIGAGRNIPGEHIRTV